MKRDERIRFIFRKRRRFTRRAAAAALGKSARWVEDARMDLGEWVSWEEMVLMSFLLWTRVQIYRALGEQTAKIFPPRAQLVTITVRIPEYKAIALQYAARRRHIDVGELLLQEMTRTSSTRPTSSASLLVIAGQCASPEPRKPSTAHGRRPNISTTSIAAKAAPQWFTAARNAARSFGLAVGRHGSGQLPQYL